MLPDLAETGSAWPYLVIGAAWGLLAVAMAVYGFMRQRALHLAFDEGDYVHPHPVLVGGMAAAGVILIIASAALVLMQT